MSTQKKVKIDPKVTAKIHEELRHMDSSESEHEIDQIMSEIELLQKRASEPVALRVVPQPETSLEEDHEPASDSLLEEFRGGGDEPSMEETLSDLRDEGPSGPSLLDDPIEAVAEETMPEEEAPEEAIEELTEEPEEKFESKEDLNTEFDKGDVMSNYEGDGTMTMVLNGNMTLKLKYELEGQEVSIGFADKMLKVQLADGTEFKIPLRPGRMLKKAA